MIDIETLMTDGFVRLPALLPADACARLVAAYDDAGLYRSTIDMARYRFGQGQYRYFAAPLPPPVQALRTDLYPSLAMAANRMAAALGEDRRYPARLDDFLADCHAAGQRRPTPLILRYGPGDYNCLHRDLYGDLHFPLQVVVALSDPADYDGGEFLLVEQRPRAQSRGHVLRLGQGEGLAFPVLHRPVAGTRGFYKASLRHGVSTVTRGQRFALGIIFHDAA